MATGPGLENSTIYLNRGDGTFKQGQLVVGNGFANAVVNGRLADVNGDGCPDALVADVNNYVWISLGDCTGNFAAPTWVVMGQANAALRVADVNGDGHLDLIASSELVQEPNYQFTAGNTISVALGDGKGNFSFARIYGGSSEGESLGIGDFKADGRPSIVTADIDTDTATIFSNDGNGGFGFPQGIYACQTNKGGFACPSVISGFGDGYTFADLNGDGKPDIFQIGQSVNFQSGNTTYSYYSLSFLNDGSGHFGASLASIFDPIQTYTQFGDYKLGDFRRTGHADLVAIGMSSAVTSSQQYILFQPGNGDGSFGKTTMTSISGADGTMATGDFDKDGKLDFVAINGDQSHILATFLGNGDGTFRSGASLHFSDSNSNISRVFASDFNRDGKLDILVLTIGSGLMPGPTLWEFDGNGNGTFQAGRQLFTGFKSMALADINNDGHPDMVRFDFSAPSATATTLSPLLINYLGQADGTFQQVSSYAPYSDESVALAPSEQMGDPLSVSTTGDYSGDGTIDEVAFQDVSSPPGVPIYAQMLMGNGDGTFTPTYDVFPFTPYVYPIHGHDLDGDKLTDMVSLDWGTGGMMIQRGAAAPALQVVLVNPIMTTNSGCGVIFPDLVSSSGRSVSLSSSVQGVVLPASITVPAGATNAKFCFTLDGTYDPHQVLDVTATMAAGSATAYGSRAYVAPFAASIAPNATQPAYEGQDTPPVIVSVQSQAQYAGGTVHFGCAGLPSGYSCEFTPTQLTLAAASSANTKLVVHSVNGAAPSSPITVLADDGQAVQRISLTLNITALSISGGGAGQPIFAASRGKTTVQFSVSGIPPYNFSCSSLPPGVSCSFAGT